MCAVLERRGGVGEYTVEGVASALNEGESQRSMEDIGELDMSISVDGGHCRQLSLIMN